MILKIYHYTSTIFRSELQVSIKTPQLWADVAFQFIGVWTEGWSPGQSTEWSALPPASSGSLAELPTIALGPAFAVIWELRLTGRCLNRI